MKRIENEVDFIIGILESFSTARKSSHSIISDKTIIDVGCGNGMVVRALTAQGAQVTGLDKENMIAKAIEEPKVGNEHYLAGQAEQLPFKNDHADVILFFASLHHVPQNLMKTAMNECYRVLKNGGLAIMVEPVSQKGSYYEVVRLVEDEMEILAKAHDQIKRACTNGFTHKNDGLYYFERSYQDYVKCLNIFVDDKAEREKYFEQALPIAKQMASDSGVPLEDYRFKSICRLDVLQK